MYQSAKYRFTLGFSLVELLVVIAIVAILGAVAYPSYQTFRLESKRSDAHASLLAVKGIITEYLVLNNVADLTASDLSSINFPPESKSKMYSLSVDATGAGYKIIATATGKQAADKNCFKIILDHQGERSSENDSATPSTDCW
jgi:type IV pilus assembly protein PilE